jgi:hypothetical protein
MLSAVVARIILLAVPLRQRSFCPLEGYSMPGPGEVQSDLRRCSHLWNQLIAMLICRQRREQVWLHFRKWTVARLVRGNFTGSSLGGQFNRQKAYSKPCENCPV